MTGIPLLGGLSPLPLASSRTTAGRRLAPCRCRSRLACNVLVMDEVLQRMDAEGVSQALTLLRSVGKETVLLVGQPGGFGSEVDAVDTVVKEGGSSWVVVGSRFESVLSL